MPEIRALVDIPTEQTEPEAADLLYGARAGVPYKIRYDNLIGTAAGRALLDDEDADAQLVTLGGGVSGTPVFKAADQAALLAALGYTGTVSGQTAVLPNGLAFRAGVGVTGALGTGIANVIFAAAFPTACSMVIATHIGTGPVITVEQNLSPGSFQIRTYVASTSTLTNANFGYIAIGY